MSVEILDKTNLRAPRIILIDENYCLNNSFDIIQTNFKTLLDGLNQTEDDFYARTVIDRYNKNKVKYQNFLTYVTQFSANWMDTVKTYETYKNVWDNVNMALEVAYPTIIDIQQWGSYSNYRIVENTGTSYIHIQNILQWANSKFVNQNYQMYQKMNVKVYFYQKKQNTFLFDAKYKENCEVSGGSIEICCDGCSGKFDYGHKGCNKSIVKGRTTCANMFDWCPVREGSGNFGSKVTGFAKEKGGKASKSNIKVQKDIISTSQCASGNCRGWGRGFNAGNWSGQELKLNGSLSGDDIILLGYQNVILNLNQTTLKWQR